MAAAKNAPKPTPPASAPKPAAPAVTFLEEDLPGQIRAAKEREPNPYLDAVKSRRAFSVRVPKDDATNTQYKLRQAAAELTMGVRIIVGEPGTDGMVQVKAQGKDKRIHKPHKPRSDAGTPRKAS